MGTAAQTQLQRAVQLKAAAGLTLEARSKDFDAALIIQDPKQIEEARQAALIAFESVLDHTAEVTRLTLALLGGEK